MNTKMLLPPKLREKAELYCTVILAISGADPLEETRRRPVVTARTIVANALMMDGYSAMAVATILGVDHSTVSHYKESMMRILHAPGYEAEREIWEKFKEKI